MWIAGPAAPWKRDALCREPSYAEVEFFPGQGVDVRPAKAVCARCLVCEECVDYGAEHTFPGIWGGTSEKQRVQGVKPLR